jgi:hypothetical protein
MSIQRKENFEEVLAKLQAAGADAVAVLHGALFDGSPSIRVRAALAIVNLVKDYEIISERGRRPLEQQTNDGECEGCIQAVSVDLAARYDALHGGVDRTSGQRTPCAKCGNPYPKIPLRIIDGLMERYDRMQKIEKDLRDRELEEANIDGPGPEGDSIGEDEEK